MDMIWGAVADWDAILLLAQAAKNTGFPPWISLWLMVCIFLALFMFAGGADKKRRREHDKMVQNLKQNDHVVTVGGIHGVIVNASSPEHVVLRVDDNNNTRLKVQRSAIVSVASEDKGTDVSKEK